MRFAQSCDGDPPLYGLVEFGVERTSPDTEAPEVWLEGPGDVTTATDATFDFAASEPATFTCSLDGAPAAPCTSPTTVTGLSAGQHEFTVVAIDGAGNVSDPAPWSWTVEPPDTAAPSVTLTGPEDRTRSGDATFRFTASEPATFTCSLDGAVATPCTSPTTVTGLGGGAHAFAVVATDVAGNVSDAVTWNWSIKGNGGGGGKGGGKPKR